MTTRSSGRVRAVTPHVPAISGHVQIHPANCQGDCCHHDRYQDDLLVGNPFDLEHHTPLHQSTLSVPSLNPSGSSRADRVAANTGAPAIPPPVGAPNPSSVSRPAGSPGGS